MNESTRKSLYDAVKKVASLLEEHTDLSADESLTDLLRQVQPMPIDPVVAAWDADPELADTFPFANWSTRSQARIRNFYKLARTPRVFETWQDIPTDVWRVLRSDGTAIASGTAYSWIGPFTEIIEG